MGSYLDKLLLGIKQVYRNGSPMPLRPVVNFVNFYEVLDNPSLGSTDIYTSTGGSGGGTLLVVEHNGSPVTARSILNFIGGSVVDNPGNASTDVSLALSTPGTPLAGAYTLLATDTWKLIQAVAGGYAINCQNLVAGQPVRLTHVGGAAGSNLFETAGQAVVLQQGASSYTFADPQNPLISPVVATSVSLTTSKVTYTICLDATGVVRCLGVS